MAGLTSPVLAQEPVSPSAQAAVASEAAQLRAATVLPIISALEPKLGKMSRDVWSLAEIGFKETKSSALLQQELKAAGFRVTPGVDGMPTAFIAEAGSGGPVIALLAEYDALPGIAQAAVPYESPVEGKNVGHACGHNLLGAASVTAAIAVKQWLQKNGVSGTIRLYGTPAEEGGFSKVYLARDGFFKDVDLTLTWHPADRNNATPSRFLAMISGKFRFQGVASHAAAAPERGRSALDGVEVMDVATNFMREHIPQEARIHYVITKGGGQPNIVPANAESFYYVRHYDTAVVKDIWERVVKAAEGAALATGTKVDVEIVSGTYGTLPNYKLNGIVQRNLERVGGYAYSPEEAAFARQILGTYPNLGIKESNPSQIDPMGPERKDSGSSDVGDVSWVTPTATLFTASFVRGTMPHSWQAAAASGTPIGEKGALVAAKTMALTAAELFLSPAEITAAKAEFHERRGPDFKYVSLIGDRKPALDYTDH
nr:amidohydrolase [Rhizorhapis sp.]